MLWTHILATCLLLRRSHNPAAFAAVTLQPRRRASLLRRSTVEDYVTSRFGCAAEEAAKFEKTYVGRSSRVERARDSCDRLQQRLDLSDAELKNLVLQRPRVLGFSYEANIEPKLTFLQEQLHFSKEMLREKIVRLPALLCFSLEKRYRPRVEQCREADVPVELVVQHVCVADEKFEQLVAQRQQQ